MQETMNDAGASGCDKPVALTLPSWMLGELSPPGFTDYFRALQASWGHAMMTLMRRKRLVLAALISFIPVLIPVALSFLSQARFAEAGDGLFVRLVEELHVNVFAPLLALFFAGMLVAEDIETRTMPYILTRPVPRSAWVMGRYAAYLVVSGAILLVSVVLTFAACAAHPNLTFLNPNDVIMLLHYGGVLVLALLAYGGLAIFLGALTKRPIVYGVALLYGWQQVATVVPGLVDFLTIKKYVDATLPVLAVQRNVVEIQTALGTFRKEVFMVSATRAIIVLLVFTAVMLAVTVVSAMRREYAADRAAGG